MESVPRGVLTRPARAADLTLAYGDAPAQVIDIRLPAPGRPVGPLVVFVHGGFWRAEWDRGHIGPAAADLADRGYLVACPEYRRVGEPGGGWPGTFEDVAAALTALPGLLARALGDGAPGFGVGLPVLVGHSAGAQLALWLAGRVPSRGVLALAPVADLTEAYRLGLDDDAVGELLGGGPDAVPERYAEVDPAARVPLPVPVVVVHGSRDEWVPVAMGREYVAQVRAAGGDARMVELPGVEHFGVIDPLSGAWPSVVDGLRLVMTVD